MKLTKLKTTGLVLSVVIMALAISTVLPAQSSPRPQSVAAAGDKDPTPPDPNRPSFDLWGNEWTATGTLMHATCPNVPDPISHQDNPQCVCPAPTAAGVYHLQGYGKDTNAAVCRIEYYQACPVADAIQASDPLCAKLQAEQPAPVTDPNQCGGK